MTQKCIQCGKNYTITDSEIEFYKSKGLSLPKRCKNCRELNKGSKGAHKKKRSSNQQQYKSYYVNQGDVKSLSAVIIAFIVTVVAIVLKADHAFVIAIAATAVFTAIKYIISLFNNRVFVQEFDTSIYQYTFYDTASMVKHYVKHGKQTGSSSMEDYLYKANMVIISKGNLTKKQMEDNDTIFYNPKTNEFVVIAKAGYVRTYFIASDKYYNKQ
jgi:hypothetical protein